MNTKAMRQYYNVILWGHVVLLVGETEYPEKTTDLPRITEKLYHIVLNRVHLSISRDSNSENTKAVGISIYNIHNYV